MNYHEPDKILPTNHQPCMMPVHVCVLIIISNRNCLFQNSKQCTVYQFNLAARKIGEFIVLDILVTGNIEEFWSARKVDISVYFMGHLRKITFRRTPLYTTNIPFKDVLQFKSIVWLNDQVTDALATNRNIANTELSLQISMP